MKTLITISLLLILPSNFLVARKPQSPPPSPPIQNGSLPLVSPNGSHIAFVSNRAGSNDLFVIQVDGTGRLQLTRTPDHENLSSWTNDSKHILFSVFKDNTSTLYSIDINGKNQKSIATIPGRSPVVSPNGKKLIYASGSWTEMSLYLSDVDGSNARLINDGKSIAWNIRWSPDGKRFAFTGRDKPKTELAVFVAKADGPDKRQISQIPMDEGAAQWPVWSSDGRRIAIQVVSRLKKGSAHIWIIDVGTGGARKLAAHDQVYLDETPSWFPDGKQLAFQSDRTGRMEVWVMNDDGTGARQLTH
jgi:TolB protein